MKTLAAILCALLIGCHTPPPRGVVVSPPMQSKEVGPTAAKVRTQIIAARDTTVILNAGLSKAVAEAKRLADQKQATEKELKAMWSLLTQEEARAQALWTQVGAANTTIDELTRLVDARDIEVANLRTGLNDANTRLADAAKWQAKVNQKVAVYDWFMHKIYWIIAIVVLIIIGYIVLIVLNRSARAALSVATHGIIPP